MQSWGSDSVSSLSSFSFLSLTGKLDITMSTCTLIPWDREGNVSVLKLRERVSATGISFPGRSISTTSWVCNCRSMRCKAGERHTEFFLTILTGLVIRFYHYFLTVNKLVKSFAFGQNCKQFFFYLCIVDFASGQRLWGKRDWLPSWSNVAPRPTFDTSTCNVIGLTRTKYAGPGLCVMTSFTLSKLVVCPTTTSLANKLRSGGV